MLLLGLVAAAVLSDGCGGDEVAAWEASNENAIAAYVSFTRMIARRVN